MIIDFSKISFFVKPGFTDMRKQINGLSIIVDNEMNQNSGSGSLFLFCSKNKKTLKCIYWDKNGFCLWIKKLEQDKFPWPMTSKEAEEITFDQLKMLLDGIDFWKAHKEIFYDYMN